ncbi:hypothetical protein CMI45_02675 [Candidatus Pacearchaeota archaeon]|nr:hypothetical protein [Candidatus Pacearchaeota archaeon]|tara:strand:+ start:1129 stop:1656 length:528 start_codon:yes stop_codon:yes gene_type:complete
MKTRKKALFTGVFVLVVLVATVMGFYYSNYGNPFEGSITGNAVGPIDVKFTPEGTQVLTYRNNLEVDNYKLPEGSADASQIPLLSALHMQQEGKNLKKYNLLGRSRKLHTRAPIEKFQSYYSNKKGTWLVSYMGKDKPFEICDVRMNPQGELVSFDCEDSIKAKSDSEIEESLEN